MEVSGLPWYYLETLGQPGEEAFLSGDEWHHAAHVLRMQEGDGLILFDGKGHCLEGRLQKVGRQEGHVVFIRDRTADFAVSGQPAITLAFAPTKNIDRTEFAVEKLVELGVSRIVFLQCEHSERVHLRLDRMQKIVISAAKQSRKVRLPALSDLTSPVPFIETCLAHQPAAILLACHLHAEERPLFANYSHPADVVLLIGPEGGFSPGEVNAFRELGVKLVTLGPHRLRVETAVIAACTQIHLLNLMNQKR